MVEVVVIDQELFALQWEMQEDQEVVEQEFVEDQVMQEDQKQVEQEIHHQ